MPVARSNRPRKQGRSPDRCSFQTRQMAQGAVNATPVEKPNRVLSACAVPQVPAGARPVAGQSLAAVRATGTSRRSQVSDGLRDLHAEMQTRKARDHDPDGAEIGRLRGSRVPLVQTRIGANREFRIACRRRTANWGTLMKRVSVAAETTERAPRLELRWNRHSSCCCRPRP